MADSIDILVGLYTTLMLMQKTLKI